MMSPAEAAFLVGESTKHPRHVGVLQIFERPADAGPRFLEVLHRKLLSFSDIRPELRRKPRGAVRGIGQAWWTDDRNMDLPKHVRVWTIAQPGGEEELFATVSRLHGEPLDNGRPLWELHLIGGLEDDRFAIYTKLHHSLADEFTAMRYATSALADEPEDTGRPMWADTPVAKPVQQGGFNPFKALTSTITSAAGSSSELLQLAGRTVVGQTQIGGPAPRTLLDHSHGGHWRVTARSWPVGRLSAIAGKTRTGRADVAIAMCAGALRRYLTEHDTLPRRSLIASVPQAVRSSDAQRGYDALGIGLLSLATDIADPVRRLEKVSDGLNTATRGLTGMTPLQLKASAMTLASVPAATIGVTRTGDLSPKLFNVTVSFIPGPRDSAFLDGALLDAIYPIAIPNDGQALNISITTYEDWVMFGVTACGRQIAEPRVVLDYLEDALAELEP